MSLNRNRQNNRTKQCSFKGTNRNHVQGVRGSTGKGPRYLRGKMTTSNGTPSRIVSYPNQNAGGNGLNKKTGKEHKRTRHTRKLCFCRYAAREYLKTLKKMPNSILDHNIYLNPNQKHLY